MNIKDLQDRYSGQIGFVVGSGPSLHFLENNLLQKIKDYPIICVNSAILKFADLGCKNLYFLSDDIAVKNVNYFHELSKIGCTYLLFEDKCNDDKKNIKDRAEQWFAKRTRLSNPNIRTYVGTTFSFLDNHGILVDEPDGSLSITKKGKDIRDKGTKIEEQTELLEEIKSYYKEMNIRGSQKRKQKEIKQKKEDENKT